MCTRGISLIDFSTLGTPVGGTRYSTAALISDVVVAVSHTAIVVVRSRYRTPTPYPDEYDMCKLEDY